MDELRFFVMRLARFLASIMGIVGAVAFVVLAGAAVVRGVGGQDASFLGQHWVLVSIASVAMFMLCAGIAVTARTKYSYVTEPPTLRPKVCSSCRREVTGRPLRCPLCGGFNLDALLGWIGLGLNFGLTCLNGLFDLIGIALGLLMVVQQKARAEKRRREDLAGEIARQLRRRA